MFEIDKAASCGQISASSKTWSCVIAAEAGMGDAIQQMLIHDVQRLFVHADASAPDHITGVLSLSDSARFRSGSCRACSAGRILMG